MQLIYHEITIDYDSFEDIFLRKWGGIPVKAITLHDQKESPLLSSQGGPSIHDQHELDNGTSNLKMDLDENFNKDYAFKVSLRCPFNS